MPPRGRKRKVSEREETKPAGKPEKPAENNPAAAEYTHWLIKSEPETRMEKGVDMRFSFQDLKDSEDSTACWDGVRNYQARNFMRQMKVRTDPVMINSYFSLGQSLRQLD